MVVRRKQDPRLKWNSDGTVRVLIGKVLPLGSAVQQTVAGRRKRFRVALDRLLSDHGWHKVRPNVYSAS